MRAPRPGPPVGSRYEPVTRATTTFHAVQSISLRSAATPVRRHTSG
ncbi:hypothetical protein TOK_6240 [Pseudonocardia sp. N23]|nr:hypothetical protein TOK_6240 [Pseudonocardia sp. N23]